MDMEINFPNLGIYLDHVGKNISIFGFSIAYYGIVIVTGMMIAIWIAQREAKRTGQNPEQYLDLAMIGIAAGILGARIYYVIFAWDYYKDDLLSIFNIRQGGLAIYGGIIGACIAVVIYSRKKKQNFSLLMDTASKNLDRGTPHRPASASGGGTSGFPAPFGVPCGGMYHPGGMETKKIIIRWGDSPFLRIKPVKKTE